MSLFDSFRNARKIRSHADSLANRLAERVWELAGVQARHLSLAEARGYFRAHSNRIVRAESRRRSKGPDGLPVASQQEAERLAAETMVIRALRQLLQFRKQSAGAHRKAA